MLHLGVGRVIGAAPPDGPWFVRIQDPHSDPMEGQVGRWRMPPMTFPTVTEVPPVFAPVTPNTFVFAVIRPGDPRPGAATQPSTRRIVD